MNVKRMFKTMLYIFLSNVLIFNVGKKDRYILYYIFLYYEFYYLYNLQKSILVEILIRQHGFNWSTSKIGSYEISTSELK